MIAILSGIVIGHLKVENLVEDFSSGKKINELNLPSLSWKQRFVYAKNYTFDIVKKVWLFIFIGIGIGAWIHGYVPADLIAKYASGNNWYAVPLAVLIGIPLYSNAAGVIPIIYTLMQKGLSLGTALAFMMAVTALSLPEMIILRKVLKPKLLAVFVSILFISFVGIGYLFNIIIG